MVTFAVVGRSHSVRLLQNLVDPCLYCLPLHRCKLTLFILARGTSVGNDLNVGYVVKLEGHWSGKR